MVTTDPFEFEEIADAHRKQKEFETAGNYYNAASSGHLMRIRFSNKSIEKGRDPSFLRLDPFGIACRDRLLSAICHNVENETDRVETLCRRGELLTRDAVRHESSIIDEAAKKGLCWELIGDFRLLRDATGYREAYDHADAQYQSVENHHGWQMETGFRLPISLVVELAKEVGIGFTNYTEGQVQVWDLTERIAFKIEYFPQVVDELSAKALAAYDRGGAERNDNNGSP